MPRLLRVTSLRAGTTWTVRLLQCTIVRAVQLSGGYVKLSRLLHIPLQSIHTKPDRMTVIVTGITSSLDYGEGSIGSVQRRRM